jgi:excisionase family DNA binding protein
MTAHPSTWLSTDEAAKLLDLPPATICTYAARGVLRRRRIGRTVQVSAASVRAYQAGRKGPGRPAKAGSS